jgi:hypothetical protein
MNHLRALLATTALVATACSGSGSDSITDVSPAETTAPASEAATATDAASSTEAPTPTTPSTEAPASEPDAELAAVAETGPVTIETRVDLAATQSAGTFQVTDGADLLGCSAGAMTEYGGPNGITNVLTCEDGDREGTLTLRWQILNSAEGPGEVNGPWNVVESSGDFADLNGEGMWSGNSDGDIGLGSFPGTIEFGRPTDAPPEPVDDGSPAWEQGRDAQVPAGTVRLPEFGGIQFELDDQRQIIQQGPEYTIIAIEDGLGGIPAEIDLIAPTATSSGQPLTTIDELTAALTDDVGATLAPIGEVETAIGVAQGFEYTVENEDDLDPEVAYLEVGEGGWAPFPFGQFWLIETERGLFMVTAEAINPRGMYDVAIADVQGVLETIEFIDLVVES